MTWFEFVVVSLACYRCTRFTSLDSLIDEPRDWVVKWLLSGDNYVEDEHEWPFNIWKRKALQWIECPYCQSVWFAIAAVLAWYWWWDVRAVQLSLIMLAVAGAAMLAYRFTDPSPPCLPRKPCE